MEFKLTKHLDKQFVDRYIDFLEEKGSTLFYQSPVFHRFLKNHLNSDLYYFLWLRKNKIVASFPFMVKRNEKVGGVLNSLPYYGSNGSLVFSHSAKGDEKNKIRNDLKDRLNSFYKDQDIVLSTLISNPLEKEEMEWLRGNWRADFKDYRIGQITELPDYSETFEDDLFDLYDNPRPRNIRRAIKAEINVTKKWDKKALEFLYTVHKNNIERIGGLAKKREFFMQIPDYFDKADYAVFVAEKEGQPIAALLVFYFNKTVEYFTPATIHEFRNDQPSALIIHEAMKAAIIEGFKYWNWGGTWESQAGVYDFKNKWGAKDYRYEYFIQIVDSSVKKIPIEKLKEAFPNFYLYPF